MVVLDHCLFVKQKIEHSKNYHSKDKIQVQLNWAKTLEAQGGVWRLCRTIEEAISCTQFDFKGLTIEEVESMLKSDKNKTIKF